jgi:hypothetical protein
LYKIKNFDNNKWRKPDPKIICKVKCFEEKLHSLYTFLEKADEVQRKRPQFSTDFYRNIQLYIRKSLSDIEKGIPVQTKRK